MSRIVIAAGGTAGHVVPALAVADALRSRGAEVEFVGGERAEAELVPAAGYPLHPLKVAGIDRRNPWRAARAVGLAAGALGTSARLLRRLGADAVMGGGGYVAGPVGLAAAALRIPLVLTEADSHLGISNRLLAPLARRVFLAFPLDETAAVRGRDQSVRCSPETHRSGARPRPIGPVLARPTLGLRSGRNARAALRPKRSGCAPAETLGLRSGAGGRSEPRFVVVGRPVPAGTATADPGAARRRFGIGTEEPCLLVFGGSIGARTLNYAALEAFGSHSPCAVLHACGRRDYEELARRLSELGDPPHYHLLAYIEPFADALAAADLTAARAGGSVLEVAAAGVPAILVPYPHATADHQTRNARLMADAGAAVVVPDSELDASRLAREVGSLIGSPFKLAAMAEAARRASRPDAADRIADELLAQAGGR